MEEKINKIIKLLEIQTQLLDKIFKLLNQSNDEFLEEINKEDLVRKP